MMYANDHEREIAREWTAEESAEQLAAADERCRIETEQELAEFRELLLAALAELVGGKW